jgi:hypothetical protein
MGGKGTENQGWMQAWYDQWERGLSAWWDRVLDTPEVLKGMNATLAGQVEARRQMMDAGQRWMERMNLPTRQDLTRMVKIVSLVEERLLGMEDHVLELQDRLAVAEKEATRARIEAAEARLELTERLGAIQAQLALITHRLPPASPALGGADPAPVGGASDGAAMTDAATQQRAGGASGARRRGAKRAADV